MPFDSIEEAEKRNFTTKIGGVKLTLPQIQHLSRIYDALKEAKKVDNPMAVAITQFKELHEVKDGTWVKKEGEKESSLLSRFVAFLTKSPKESMTFDEVSVALTKITEADASIKFKPDELILGKPQLVLVPRATHTAKGKKRVSFSEADLQKMEKNYNAGYRPGIPDGMSIDYPGDLGDIDHKAAYPDGSGSMVQKPNVKIGRIAAAWITRLKYVKGKGLYAIPLWVKDIYDNYIVTKKLRGISSYIVTNYHEEKDNRNIGPMFVNFTLTNDPQYPLPVILGREEADDYIATYFSFDEKIPNGKEEDFMEREKLIEVFKLDAKATDEDILAKVTEALEHEEMFKKVSEKYSVICDTLDIDKDANSEDVKGVIATLQKRPETSEFQALKTENEANAKRIEKLETETYDSKIKARIVRAEASLKVKPADIKRDDNEGDPFIMGYILSQDEDADEKFDQLLARLTVIPELEGPKGGPGEITTESFTAEEKQLIKERGWTEEEAKEYKNPESSISFVKEPATTQ